MELGAADASGRRRLVPVKGAVFEMPCDAIVYAIGQKVALEVVLKGKDGALNKYNTLDAHEITGEVSALPRIIGGRKLRNRAKLAYLPIRRLACAETAPIASVP